MQPGNVGAAQPAVSTGEQHHRERGWLLNSHVFFRAVQDGAHLFQGITDSTMSHGEGWHYIQLGRFVERTESLARLIGTHFASLSNRSIRPSKAKNILSGSALLKSCAAFEAYCKNYTAELRPLRVAEFLLLNPEFPHSVRFSVDMVHAALAAIGIMTERKEEQPVRLAGRLQATLSFSQIEEIMASRRNGVRGQRALAVRASSCGNPSGVFRLFRGISTRSVR